MKKHEMIKQYGKERIQEMHSFLDKINRFYGFPYSEENLYDFVVSLRRFNKEDLENALELLEDRESTFQIKFNEIKLACKHSLNKRISKEENNDFEEMKENAVPMPPHIKEKLNKIFG